MVSDKDQCVFAVWAVSLDDLRMHQPGRASCTPPTLEHRGLVPISQCAWRASRVAARNVGRKNGRCADICLAASPHHGEQTHQIGPLVC